MLNLYPPNTEDAAALQDEPAGVVSKVITVVAEALMSHTVEKLPDLPSSEEPAEAA